MHAENSAIQSAQPATEINLESFHMVKQADLFCTVVCSVFPSDVKDDHGCSLWIH